MDKIQKKTKLYETILMLAIKKTTGGNDTDLHQWPDEHRFGGWPISLCGQFETCHKRNAMCEPQVRERVIMSIMYGLIFWFGNTKPWKNTRTEDVGSLQ